jgi:hypothetical protein
MEVPGGRLCWQLHGTETTDPGVIRRALDARLQRGEEPTKGAAREAVANVVRLADRRSAEPQTWPHVQQ